MRRPPRLRQQSGGVADLRKQIDMTHVTPACVRPTKQHREGRTGTPAGYMAHRYADETACAPCVAAWTAKTAARKANLSPGRLKQERKRATELAELRRAAAGACTSPTPEHPEGSRGTIEGYAAHIALGQVPCQPCRDASMAHDYEAVCARPTRKFPNGRTGTRSGYLAHVYAGESACRACLAGSAAHEKESRTLDPEKAVRDALWSKYRMTLDGYRALLKAQGGKCAICGTDSPTDFRTSRFHVDHDHACCPTSQKTCGKCVRGLLCHACNTALGNFKDDPVRLRAALAYVMGHES